VQLLSTLQYCAGCVLPGSGAGPLGGGLTLGALLATGWGGLDMFFGEQKFPAGLMLQVSFAPQSASE
jgi:hypothetical protein